MALSFNDRPEAKRQLYTGLAHMQIKAVNPTMQELNDVFGYKVTKEPTYLTEVESRVSPGTIIRQLRLELHFESIKMGRQPEGIRARNSLFLRYEYVPGFYINNFGRFNKDKANEDFAKDAKFIEQAYDGEMDMMLVLEALSNPDKGADFYLENRAQLIYYGDTTEVRALLTRASKRTVQCLLGVQSDASGKHYQTTLKKVLPSWQKKLEKIHEAYVKNIQYIKDTEFGPIDVAYSEDDLRLREWYPFGEGPEPEQGQPAAASPAPAAAPLTPPAPAATTTATAPVPPAPMPAATLPVPAVDKMEQLAKLFPVPEGEDPNEWGQSDNPLLPFYNPRKLPF